HAEGDEVETQLRAIEKGVIPLDDPRLFQLAHAPQARRRRNADSLRKLDIRYPAIALQFAQYLDVYGVQIRTKHGFPLRFPEAFSQKRIERKDRHPHIARRMPTDLLLMQGCP